MDSLNLEGPVSICPTDSIKLNLVDVKRTGYKYLWFFNNDSLPLQRDTFLFAKKIGAYSLRVTDNLGCSIKSRPVLINHEPYPPLPSVRDTNYCLYVNAVPISNHVTVTSSNLYSLVWYNSVSALEKDSLATPPTPATSALGTQYFYVAQKNKLTGCVGSRAKISVFINPYPVATVLSALNVSNDTAKTGVIRLSVTNGAEPYTYIWDTIANNTAYSFPRTTKDITLIPKGTYRSIITDKKGCKDTIIQPILYQINDIDAINDDFRNNLLTTAGGIAGNIYLNDSLNHFRVDTSDVTPTIVDNGGIGGLVIDGKGNVIVPPGTLPGTYTVTYKICEVQNLINCDNATILINVAETDPDVNITQTNVPVSGSVSTNDDVLAGTKYGTPTPVSGNPTGGVLTLDSTGRYTF
ncbi:MAG: hypothetical protein ACKOZZ_10505, partial [Bacteroidota bacterium]